MFGTAEFERLLTDASKQLYVNNRATMRSGQLLATPNQVDTGDVELFFRGVRAGLVGSLNTPSTK